MKDLMSIALSAALAASASADRAPQPLRINNYPLPYNTAAQVPFQAVPFIPTPAAIPAGFVAVAHLQTFTGADGVYNGPTIPEEITPIKGYTTAHVIGKRAADRSPRPFYINNIPLPYNTAAEVPYQHVPFIPTPDAIPAGFVAVAPLQTFTGADGVYNGPTVQGGY